MTLLSFLADALRGPWPWWFSGPLIGLFVPALLLVGNKHFGISSNLRHLCAATVPGRVAFFHYDWRRSGAWNLAFAAGIVLGGAIAVRWLGAGDVHISIGTRHMLASLGLHDLTGLVPRELFRWSALATARGILLLGGGGLLIGFGTAYAGGCTSGHAISGLAALQLPSLVAVIGFFAGGLIGSWFILPHLV